MTDKDSSIDNRSNFPGRHWHKLDDGRIQCDICPRYCQLRDGQRGFCFVRQNIDDQMILTTYGRSSGFCIDPIEKKPLNHFYPGTSVLSFGTAGCNLGCRFCQNWDISKAKEWDRLTDQASPEKIARVAKMLDCRSVAFTYNDPVIFAEYAIDFGNQFHISSMDGFNIRSSAFKVLDISNEVYLYDTPNTDKKTGSLGLFSLNAPGSTTPMIERQNIGVVNYNTGRITLNPINIVSGKTKDAQQIMEISVVPESNDVIGLQDLYLQLDTSNVEMVVDEIASGADPSGSTYTVTSSYTDRKIVR